MSSTKQPPEELELCNKEELLQQKRDVLAELELSFSTLQAKLRSFSIEYYLKVGSKYVQIDQLQATLDKILLSKIPFDTNAKKRATESKERAEQSARDAEEFKVEHDNKRSRFEATPELRALYRELAKLLHPDLTLDPSEKTRRHSLMQLINQAYQAGNIKKLQEIMDSEKNNPDNVRGDDIGSALVRVIRKIAQVEKRIIDLEGELNELRKTDLCVLFECVTKQRQNGKDLLEEMATEQNSRITFLKQQMERENR